jgi:hypothetical protein
VHGGAVEVAVAAAVEPVTTMRPLLAGIGLAPASAAYAASSRQRPGWDQDMIAWAALTGPTPRLASSCGARWVTRSARWICYRRVLRRSRRGRGGGPRRAAGQRMVGVAAGEQQRAQAIDRPRLGCGEFPASAEQNA